MPLPLHSHLKCPHHYVGLREGMCLADLVQEITFGWTTDLIKREGSQHWRKSGCLWTGLTGRRLAGRDDSCFLLPLPSSPALYFQEGDVTASKPRLISTTLLGKAYCASGSILLFELEICSPAVSIQGSPLKMNSLSISPKSH